MALQNRAGNIGYTEVSADRDLQAGLFSPSLNLATKIIMRPNVTEALSISQVRRLEERAGFHGDD